MRYPHRMNLVDIEVKVLAKEGRVAAEDRPVLDPVYKRPKGKKTWVGDGESETVSFRAQVYFGRQEEKTVLKGGDSPDTDAHLTMRKSDWDALTVKPRKGDLIVTIAGEAVNYEIVEVRRAGFLRGRANLIQLEFEKSKELYGSV